MLEIDFYNADIIYNSKSRYARENIFFMFECSLFSAVKNPIIGLNTVVFELNGKNLLKH
jgi:hypothetical protein